MDGIGNRIKKVRAEANFSQEKLAELVGVSKKTIVNYENGSSDVPYSNLLKIAEVCNIDKNWLFFGEDKKETAYTSKNYRRFLEAAKKQAHLNYSPKKTEDSILTNEEIDLILAVRQYPEFKELIFTALKGLKITNESIEKLLSRIEQINPDTEDPERGLSKSEE